MAYWLNPVKGDIERLDSLFTSLSEIFRKQIIDHELLIKLSKLNGLMNALTEMVNNSEKRYKVDDEEMQDEGGALDDEEKQHERSVLEVKKHERIVLDLWLEELEDAVFNTEDLVHKIHTEALRHKLDEQICKKMEDIRCSLESYAKAGDLLGLASPLGQMNQTGTWSPASRDSTIELSRQLLPRIVSESRAGPTYKMECRKNLQKMQYPMQSYQPMEKLHPMEINTHNDPKEKQRQRGPIEQLLERQRQLGPIKQPLERQRQPLDSTDYIYSVDESEEFGMDYDKEEIIKLLLSDDANDRQLSVISITGNGRIGKTTLARLVYDEQRVSQHFDKKAWVNVPDDFSWVTKSILKELSLRKKYKDLNKLELDQLGFELQNYLKRKRFLLVLDGAKQIPSSKEWEALQSAFKFTANGSRIIVTTRKKVIASMKYTVRTYCMEPLSEEKCWPIFAKFAFGDQNPTSDTQLEVIGKKIVQMCHGLPSSVRILGSLLRFKLQQEEWEAILKRLKPSSDPREDSRENINVVPNLRLPEHLKRCLAYCSIFPQDYEFEKEKLVLLWMAEGFLKPPSTRKTMKEASKSIDELKSFFQQSSRNESSFLMCLNNLAAYMSTRYCFRLEDNHPSQIPLNTRYLSLVGGKYENSVIFEAIDRAKLLRTFLPLDHESRHLCATELQNLLSKLQLLRVLSLSHYHITEIPDSIGNLEHLRYIDLSHTPIKRLPESVCELYNLQSLILSNCHSLTKLPENTSNLRHLINLDVSGSCLSEMPKGMSELGELKLLSSFVVGKTSGSALGELCLIKLEGTLHISKLQNVASKDDALGASLSDKCLHELVLEWDEDAADPKNATEVLGGLRPNETCLAKLTINFYNGTQFAKWFKWWKFDHLFFLRLSNCKNCSTLPLLSNLPSLRVLIIECMDAVEEVGPDFSAETSTSTKTEFKSLEILTFEGMSKWTKWAPSNVLPCLKQLCIRRCPKLRGNLPMELPSVERVEISESQELVTPHTKETSLKILHYFKKIVFISDDEVTSFTSERATGSSSIMIEGKVTKKPKETEERGEIKEETEVEIQTTSKTNWSKHKQKESTKDPSQFPFSKEKSSLPLPQHVAECSSLVTLGTEERGDSEQETHLEAETAPETKESKLEQEEYTKEDPSSLFLEEKSLLPPTQDASESSLPQPQASPKSLLPMTHNVVESSLPLPQLPFREEKSSLPLPQDAAECSSLVTLGTEESGDSEQETHLEAETTSETKESKLEQKEYTKEDPSSLFSEEKSLFNPTQDASISSLPQSQASLKSFLPMSHDVVESSLSLPQHAIECSSLVTQGTKERGDSEQKTHLEAEIAPKTKESKLEQEKYTKEDLSSLFSEEKSLLPPTQDALESSLPQPQASPKSLLPIIHDVVECSSLVTPGTEERGDSEQETHLEAETVSETNESKLEQEEYTKEDPSSRILEEKSLLPPTQDASESSLPQPQDSAKSLLPTTEDAVETSLPMSQTPNFKEKPDDLTNTWSNPDGPQYLSFKSMKVTGILQLIELPEGLHSLRIEGCDALEDIPEGIMAGLNLLQHLYIINCCSLNSFPEDHPPTALKKLYIQNCKKLEIFSPTKRTHQYERLEHLCIGSSDSLISLPLDFFPKLKSISIWDCANLQSLSMPVKNQKDLTSLEALEIRDCPKLEYFLNGGLSAPNLMSIWLSNCKNLKELPDQLDTLINSLLSLFINNCPELVSLPKLPSSLSLLSITFCYKLELVMDWGLHSLWNLSRLEIECGCKNVESFPEKGLLPSNLNSLCISGLLNLKYLKCEELRHLTALKTLEISCCNKLQPFPEEDLPSSLSSLCIKECSLLKTELLNKRKLFD